MTTAIPSKLGAPQTLAKLITSSPAMAARQGLAFVGRETLWTADIFARLTISVLVLRAVSRLTAEWFFPKEIWNQSDQILKGFAGEDEAPPVGERPRLMHEQAGWRFYQHRTQYQGQFWVCPLLKPEPCAQCEWFVAADDGRNWCADVAKVRTLLYQGRREDEHGMRADGRASETAIFAALQRAVHQILDEPPRILEDPVAVGLVPGSTEEAIRNAAEELQRPTMKVLRSTFVFRSRFAEDACGTPSRRARASSCCSALDSIPLPTANHSGATRCASSRSIIRRRRPSRSGGWRAWESCRPRTWRSVRSISRK
jgi:hypothetical protein